MSQVSGRHPSGCPFEDRDGVHVGAHEEPPPGSRYQVRLLRIWSSQDERMHHIEVGRATHKLSQAHARRHG